MNNYYLTLVLNYQLEEGVRKGLLESIVSKVDKVTKEDLWGNKDLVYPIKKQRKGYYAHYELESTPDKIPALDRSLKLEEDIIRHLLIRK